MKRNRQLAAIMFTDIVGYTALMNSNEQLALTLLEKNRAIHKPLITKFGGQFLKEMGDGVLASFDSSTEAVMCAAAIQTTAKDQQIGLRIGLHEGEVIFQGGDIFGEGVNIASRIEPLAKPGQIVVTESIYRNVHNKQGIKTEFLSEEYLKNVSEPWKIYAIQIDHHNVKHFLSTLEHSAPQKAAIKKPKGRLIRRLLIIIGSILIILSLFYGNKYFTNQNPKIDPSIAVLPFRNIGREEADIYLADGVKESIISHLSKIKGLKVISRTSVEQYRETSKSSGAIASELGVKYLLEGSTQTAGNEIRIMVQLINAQIDDQLWSDSYDRDLGDIFAVQSEIAYKVADALKIQITPDESERILTSPTHNMAAYDLYVKGRFFWNKRTEKELFQSLEIFKQAVNLDPEFALAWSGIADAYCMLEAYGFIPSEEAFSQAKKSALQAIELNNTLAEGHTSLAWAYASDHEWIKSERGFEQAIKYEPSYSTAHSWYAWILTAQKKLDLAILHIEKARILDPLSHIIMASAGYIYNISGEYSRAVDILKSGIEMNPGFPRHPYWLGFTYLNLNQMDSARIYLEKAVELSNRKPQYLATLGSFYGSIGQFEKAQGILDEIEKYSAERFVSNFDIGLAMLGVGEVNKAMDFFDEALDKREFWPIFLAVDPRFNEVREHPRIQSIITKLDINKAY